MCVGGDSRAVGAVYANYDKRHTTRVPVCMPVYGKLSMASYINVCLCVRDREKQKE